MSPQNQRRVSAIKARRELLWIGVAVTISLLFALLARYDVFALPGAYTAATFAGKMFLRLLKMIIVPLVVTTVIVGISGIDTKNLKSLSLATVAYYLTTTAMAVAMGMLFVNTIKPGVGIELSNAAPPEIEQHSIMDVVLAIVPENIVASLASPSGLLGVIFFSILVGVAAAVVGEEARPIREWFISAERVILRITEWVLALTPFGIAGLLYTAILDIPPGELSKLPAYVFTVVGALLAHALITLPLILAWVARCSPWRMWLAMSPALMTAFSTASSSATLPQTMECAEERAGASERTVGFVLPLGATVNMDGTALYEAVAAIFVAQAYGMTLGLGSQVLIFLTASLAAIGAAGVPSAGLVTMVIVFETVGLPVEGIGIILAVDRVLDMLRTAVNVWGDSCGVMVVDRWFSSNQPEKLVSE